MRPWATNLRLSPFRRAWLLVPLLASYLQVSPIRRGWLWVPLLTANSARAETGLTKEQVLTLAFPNAKIERHEHFLTEAQKVRVDELSGTELKTRFIVAYEARQEGQLVGVAIFDTHVVRTLPETAMVALSANGTVVRVEVVQFREPDEYRAPAAWVRQLEGKVLSPSLSLKAEIHPLSGASLTAGALVDASRRVLALFQLLYGSKPLP
jgi:electron transport complex protein RnfG